MADAGEVDAGDDDGDDDGDDGDGGSTEASVLASVVEVFAVPESTDVETGRDVGDDVDASSAAFDELHAANAIATPTTATVARDTRWIDEQVG